MNNSNKFNLTALFHENDKWEIRTSEKFLDSDLDIIKNMPVEQIRMFTQDINLVSNNSKCPSCTSLLTKIYFRKDRNPFFKCSKASCNRTTLPAYKNSIFELTKLPIIVVLKLLYFFSCRWSIAEAVETLDISRPTVVDFYKFFRSALLKFLDKYSYKLGGNGIVIHFDETPITHRYGLVGRHLRSNTVWVVGAVDIYTKKCFLKFLPSRSRNDL